MPDSQLSVDSLIERGNHFAEVGELDKAKAFFQEACQRDPQSHLALFGLGTVLYRMEDDSAAYQALWSASKLAPNVPEIWNNIGAVCGRQGRIESAINAFRHVCTLDPKHASAPLNLGRLLLNRGQPEEAERWLRQADLARPHHSITLRLMANARLAMGQPRLALQAGLAATEAAPDDPWALLAIGKAYLALRKLNHAREAFHAVLKHVPKHPDTTYYLAETEEKAGRIEEARSLFEEVLELDIDPAFRTLLNLKRALALPVISLSKTDIESDRSRIEHAVEGLARAPVEDPYGSGGFTNFYLAYQAKNDRLIQEQIAQFYLQICPALSAPAPNVGEPVKQDLYKVAILSSFLRSHTVGYLCRGLIEHLDRSRFHVTLLRSPVLPLHDPVAPEIAACADEVIDLPDSLPAARTMVANVKADLLYFPEIGMEDLVYFLAFARSAPVQVMGWGHPVTSGIPNMDVFLSVADMEPDDAQDHYSERLITTERLSLCVSKPGIASGESDKSQFGIDPDAPAYLCAQSLFKIHPEFDSVFASLLSQDETARLYFIEIGTHSDDVFMDRLSKVVKGDMDRVKLLKRVRSEDFVALLKSADVLLDVPHWAGGKTSLESLAAGTPVVHWPGSFMRGRHTLAFYKRLDVMDCVVQDAESYVSTAIRLVHDTEFRTSVRDRIAEKADLLFNDTAAINEISDIFERLIAESR